MTTYMFTTWWSRTLLFAIWVSVNLAILAISAWFESKITRQQEKNASFSIAANLAISSWSILGTVFWVVPCLNRRIPEALAVWLMFPTHILRWSFALWSAIGVPSCKHFPSCVLFKLMITLAWIEPLLFIMVIYFPPNVLLLGHLIYGIVLSIAHWMRIRCRLLWGRALRRILALQDAFPGSFKCAVCLEDRRRSFSARFAPCHHPLCRACARDYVSFKLRERQFPVLCPVCVAETERDGSTIGALDDFLMRRIKISSGDTAVFAELEIASFSVLVECPQCVRSTYVDKNTFLESKVIACPSPGCSYTWCKTCTWATESTNEVVRQHSCDGAVELKKLVNSVGWRYCPGCGTPMERVAGCNHMTCNAGQCRTHWCWPCGEAVPSSGFAKHNKRCRKTVVY